MNYSHATDGAKYLCKAQLNLSSWTVTEGTHQTVDIWRGFTEPHCFPHLQILALHHLACGNVSCLGSFLSPRSCIWSFLMNDSFTVFLRLCACGLCGLSHSEEPCGDIFGDGLSWVGAHTESLTDAGSKERGMFSYEEETRLNVDYGGRVSPREKVGWLLYRNAYAGV